MMSITAIQLSPMSTISLNDLAEAVWNDISGINPWTAFKDLNIGQYGSDEASVLDKLAIVADDIKAASEASAPSAITKYGSAEYACYYDFNALPGSPAFRVDLSVEGTGVNKLFGVEDAIGSVTVTGVTLGVTDSLYPEASGSFHFVAGSGGVVIDFDSGLDYGPTFFDGVFNSFTFTSDYLNLIAEGDIQFELGPDAGDTWIEGNLYRLVIAYPSVLVPEDDQYRLEIQGYINFRQNFDGSFSIDGSEFSAFNIEESGNHIEYDGNFTWHGDFETGHMSGSVYRINIELAGTSFDFSGNIYVDDDGLLSGYITDLTVHAEGTDPERGSYDVTYSFTGKHVNVLDLLEADGNMKDIDGDGNTDENDLFTFLADHIEGATLTGVNLPPDANDDAGATDNKTTLTVDAEHGLLANDTDYENDALVITEVNGWSGNVGMKMTYYSNMPMPPYASVAVASLTIHADGSYEFIPEIGLSNLPAGQTVIGSVNYTISDEYENTSEATLTITVTGVSTNHAPTVSAPVLSNAQEGALSYMVNLLTNANDADGNTMNVAGVTYNGASSVPAGLTLTGNMLTVDPSNSAFNSLATGASRTINLNYTITDGHGGTVAQTATVTITGVNDAPTSTADSVTTADNADKVLALTDFGAFHDVDGDLLSSVTINSLPVTGSLKYTSDGTNWNPVLTGQVFGAADITAGHLKYVPVTGMTSATIGFHVSDGALSSPDYTLTIYAEHVDTLNEGDNTVGGSTVDVPTNMSAESRSLDAGTVGEQLHAFIDSNEQDGVIANQELIHQQIEDYMADHPGVSQVHELTLTPEAGFTGGTVTIDCNPSGDEVMVIDASALPHGTVIDLNNIGFAIIIGPGYYEGGAGSNIIVADGGSQFIILGPDNDTTHGGAGDDTIGSTEGNDDLYGDEDNDIVFGGSGDDSLHGGTGNDTIAGGSVTVHADGSHTVTDDAGHDLIDGGDGMDTVEFSGAYADYLYSYDNATDSWTVQSAMQTSAEGDDNVDTITGAEVFSFTDGTHNAAAHDCSVDVTYWKSGAGIDGVTSTITDKGNEQETIATPNGGGQYGYTGLIEGNYLLEASKILGSNDGKSVKADDALAALKLAYGINPNGGASVSNYQYLASDIDHNGKVQAADALSILKMAYNLPSAPQKAWVIVDESIGSETMSRSSVNWSGTDVDVMLNHEQELSLVGVLMGDVNGSWVAS